MTVFALKVIQTMGPVLIVVDETGNVRYKGTKTKIAQIKTALRSSTATMSNLDDSGQTTPLRLVRKLFAVFGTGAYQVLKGQNRLNAELQKEKANRKKGRVT